MDNQALICLEALRKHNVDRGWVNFDLYRLLYRPELYEVAYEKIKSKPGNMTAGSDGQTLDGFSHQTIRNLIASLRDESFQFQPARRTHIPKANGKMRALGIPSPRDKVVQEALRLILEAIYDSPHGAYFLESSHGFRPNRSCHTALREFSERWSGVTWIIEGDIKSCFDEIDHHVLVNLLKRKIADGRFLNLIWKALRTGYLWGKERRDTLTGSPQGSILSPILANIYLHELDCFVEQLRLKYDKGQERCR
jgi:group II intron reverse transcriptase/maturase